MFLPFDINELVLRNSIDVLDRKVAWVVADLAGLQYLLQDTRRSLGLSAFVGNNRKKINTYSLKQHDKMHNILPPSPMQFLLGNNSSKQQ